MNNQDFWGSEFIDDGNFGAIKEVFSSLKYLPLDLVVYVADQSYLGQIWLRDKEHIENLIASIQANGFEKPGLIDFDNTSVRLTDGNHRLVAAQHLGLQYFPVELRQVDEIKVRSVRLYNFFQKLLESQWQDQS